jgi:hypothetical protein
MKELIVGIFTILLMIIIMTVLIPFYYSRLRGLNPENFKKIKIKKLSRFFVGYGGKTTIYSDVINYGIVLPIFILHIVGYAFSILSSITSLLLYFAFDFDIITIELTIFVILFCEIVILLLTDLCCTIFSKHKDKKKNN